MTLCKSMFKKLDVINRNTSIKKEQYYKTKTRRNTSRTIDYEICN